MTTKHVFDGIRTLYARHMRGRSRFALASLLLLASSRSGEAHATECAIYDNGDSSYPALSGEVSPDISGEPSVVLHMELDQASIELGGCVYTVDRPVEVDFGDQDVVTAMLELPASSAGWTLFVTRDGVWTETMTTTSTSVAVMLWPDSTTELELAVPEQPRPIKPLIVLEPTPHNPAP